MNTIDINCDLGEGIGHDASTMPYISSCNVACGGHTGDLKSITQTLVLAQKYDVKVGAHPSFDDPKHFGRVHQEWDRSRFRESVTTQINLFTKAADSLSMPLNHVKMHGALYHATAHQSNFASWTIELIRQNHSNIPLYGPPDCLLHQMCIEHGHPFIAEAFIDRRYDVNGTLVKRTHPQAVITDPLAAANQLISLVTDQQVQTTDGGKISLKAQTYCLHGDNSKLIERLPEFFDKLSDHGISIK